MHLCHWRDLCILNTAIFTLQFKENSEWRRTLTYWWRRFVFFVTETEAEQSVVARFSTDSHIRRATALFYVLHGVTARPRVAHTCLLFMPSHSLLIYTVSQNVRRYFLITLSKISRFLTIFGIHAQNYSEEIWRKRLQNCPTHLQVQH